MTNPVTARDGEGTTEVKTKEQAAVRAYDALTAAGYDSVVTSMPHRTRSTWIVPATSEDGTWRVHIDPLTGETRIVEAPSRTDA